jgi:transposase-like protein
MKTMTKTQTPSCRKKDYEKVSFDLKLSVIDEIKNGRISTNHASKVYGISRSTITYWNQKLTSFAENKKGMSKNDEIKKLKERIEALEFIKDFQQDIIADFENLTGECISKKSLPETLAKEIEKKKRKLLKQSGSTNVSE